MVNNILIFRTDRIGDLLFTCPAIISIKKHLKDTKITLIASDKTIFSSPDESEQETIKNAINNKYIWIFNII